jgi:hypothetical protein
MSKKNGVSPNSHAKAKNKRENQVSENNLNISAHKENNDSQLNQSNNESK